jgi:hypothetical protein
LDLKGKRNKERKRGLRKEESGKWKVERRGRGRG